MRHGLIQALMAIRNEAASESSCVRLEDSGDELMRSQAREANRLIPKSIIARDECIDEVEADARLRECLHHVADRIPLDALRAPVRNMHIHMNPPP